MRRPLLALLLASCATLPEPSGGGDNLPSAAAGPFRALVQAEFDDLHTAPDGIADTTDFGRDITVLDADGDPSTLEVFAYVAAAAGMAPTSTSPTTTLVRYDAPDGRSFGLQAEVVLQADASWEGGVLASPSAVLMQGGEVLLFYAAQGGIGLAKSPDGHTFTKVPGPVLGPVTGGWEQGHPPASPGVVALPDGTLRMFYELPDGAGATLIGEATSTDGVSWTRLGDAPALLPSGGSSYDAASVGSPFPVLATSAEGRAELRLYYGARDAMGTATIGLAARFGTDGPLFPAVSPVFGTGNTRGPREPCVVSFAGFSLLYATQATSLTQSAPVIAVGVSPATVTLPTPASM